MFRNYFANLFTTTNPSQAQLEAVLQNMPRKVTKEMNEELERPFTAEEILVALSQMCPTKAPGPNGLPAAFFSKTLEVSEQRSAGNLSPYSQRKR
ncbi:hypothetical protein AB3S75_015517 [Citrus x aurantiifolia]